MTLIEISLLLFLVLDPFGNLPFVLAVLGKHTNRDYRRAIIREVLLALVLLLAFVLSGDHILRYLNIEQSSLAVAGGVILFLIPIKMTLSLTPKSSRIITRTIRSLCPLRFHSSRVRRPSLQSSS